MSCNSLHEMIDKALLVFYFVNIIIVITTSKMFYKLQGRWQLVSFFAVLYMYIIILIIAS